MSGHDDDELSEPSEEDKASGDFVWDEEESEALWQALMDAELTASADGVRAFLKQVDKVVPLSAEEEVELAKRIKAGRQATKVLTEMAERGAEPTDAQRSDLMRICRDGDHARDDLLEANLRLVVSLAKRYADLVATAMRHATRKQPARRAVAPCNRRRHPREVTDTMSIETVDSAPAVRCPCPDPANRAFERRVLNSYFTRGRLTPSMTL